MEETDESRPWAWSRNSLKGKKVVLNDCYRDCFVPLLGVLILRFIDQIIKQVSVGIALNKCVLK